VVVDVFGALFKNFINRILQQKPNILNLLAHSTNIMKISHWIKAFRLRTLFLSLSCIWAGILCVSTDQEINPIVSWLNVLTALFLQILSNLANDYGDSVHGADSDQRKGPKRMVQSGQISAKNMKIAMVIAAALSLLSGSLLLFFALPIIGTLAISSLFGIGILSILAAIAYTNGKRPYGYAGLGDISVFIFFGFVAVMGTQYLQTASISLNAVYLSIAYGGLSVGVLNLNNMRDIESDQTAGKKSIPVRLGLQKAQIYHSIVLVISFFGLNQFLRQISFPGDFTIPIAGIYLWNLIAAKKAKDYQSFDPLLKWLSLSTLLITLIIYFGKP
jgi:1,4-dihydroxy-2-naphthoate octaprenyltransferase